LNVRTRPGDRVRLVLEDPARAWAELGNPALTVTLSW